MAEDKIVIRLASPKDANQLLEIYTPYITDTAVTFECDVPTPQEFEKRISRALDRYPYLIAVAGGETVGYAYASILKNRKAYEHSVELSVYVSRDKRGRGVGSMLYSSLEKILVRQNVTNLYACVAYTDRKNDRHLDNSSPAFHERMGFKTVGHFNSCSYKFGKLYDVLWMEKIISDKIGLSFIPFCDLNK